MVKVAELRRVLGNAALRVENADGDTVAYQIPVEAWHQLQDFLVEVAALTGEELPKPDFEAIRAETEELHKSLRFKNSTGDAGKAEEVPHDHQ
jgi:hypothetical protein